MADLIIRRVIGPDGHLGQSLVSDLGQFVLEYPPRRVSPHIAPQFSPQTGIAKQSACTL